MSSQSFQGMSDEEVWKIMGNPCAECAIIDRGLFDTSGLFRNLPKMYSEIHHQIEEDEPCTIPTCCHKWILLAMNERIHLLANASGIICKVCLSKTTSWNSVKSWPSIMVRSQKKHFLGIFFALSRLISY